ncbi:MAG TPA: phosphonate ABC transporter, permease protein PhnE [Rhizobiales bacterium]|nr:phosphonate ABC transporter, permease protein PhnE [Hyphomicrobiales bacterium]
MAVLEVGIDLPARKAAADKLFARKRLFAVGVPVLVLAYLTYIFFAFDLPGIAARAKLENAGILLADTYSYKTHVERDNRRSGIKVAIEGEAKGTYAAEKWPEWIRRQGEATIIDLGSGHVVRFDADAVRYDVPGYGLLTIVQREDGVSLDAPSGPLPDWINASDTRVALATAAGRLTVTRNRAEVFRYSFGWELFWFTLDSPFYGKTAGELLAMVVSGDAVRPGTSNLSAMLSDFWNNAMWRHGDVAWAIFETVLMAFLGTMGAAIVALPLAFLSARRFTPGLAVRLGVRRVFDFLRGVDGLIWTIVLSRAFGPGPLTGSLAMLLTDTGTFGKLFSEALENVDEKQVDGLRSTGANALQRSRFGVVPQVAPVILSQVLYNLESNTRSATVIGAIVGGGIGLLLTQAIQTQKDWEEVSYYIILTLLMVMMMDVLSGWLRRKLIGGSSASARAR